MSMVRANSMSNVPIESKLMRCSSSNNPANKPESIENNKQAYICQRCCWRRWWCCRCRLLRVDWLLLLMVSLLRLVATIGSSNCRRISCCKWLNFPNNLNVESSASVDSIVCTARCTACSIAYRLPKRIRPIPDMKRKKKTEKVKFKKIRGMKMPTEKQANRLLVSANYCS